MPDMLGRRRRQEDLQVLREASCVSLGALLTALVLVAATQAAPQSADEVVIHAQRETLRQLQTQILQLEDQFYARFNALNTNPDFVVTCTTQATTGSRFVHRVCTPAFVDKATAAGLYRWDTGGSVEPPVHAITAKYPRFNQALRELVQSNPSLYSLLAQQATLRKRYETLRRQLAAEGSPTQE
jgi:hypothetical protein